MLKWRLILKTLPIVACVVVLALIRDYVLQVKGVIQFSDVSPLLSAVALIIGFMMAGVLADYKESEKIPGEIATTLETIGDTVHVVIALNKEADVSQFEQKFGNLVSIVEDWFMRRVSVDKCYAMLDDFRLVVTMMHPAAGVSYSLRGLEEMHHLRRLITRVEVIVRTSFLPVGYALLDLLVGTTLVLLLISNYTSPIAEYFLISLFSLIYIYLDQLIRDVDDPFVYASKEEAAGNAEVDPSPLREYRRRFEANRKSEVDDLVI
jgi:predicted membrane chloride channel (bestrophin family)